VNDRALAVALRPIRTRLVEALELDDRDDRFAVIEALSDAATAGYSEGIRAAELELRRRGQLVNLQEV
jgi:hypothetical protein